MAKTELRYRTFEQLIEDVKMDFRSYSLQGDIHPEDYIKVATRVNYDLGLRINQDKDTVLEVEKGRVRLPDDFYVLNYSFLVKDETVTYEVPHGRHVEEIGMILPCEEESSKCDVPVVNDETVYYKPCGKETTCVNKCGEEYQLLQRNKVATHTYNFVCSLKIEKSNKVNVDCVQFGRDNGLKVWVQDGFLMCNFESGKVYINYIGDLVDEEGSLLIPDHPFLNDYYEYAVKRRVIENLIFEDKGNGSKLQLIESRYREARNNALTIVNTPDFSEMRTLWRNNRKAQYNKYYDMFKSY